MFNRELTNFANLKGKTISKIDVYDDCINFKTQDEYYTMLHYQDCCEDVVIHDISGDVNDLINSEILLAEEVINEEQDVTWTFYKLQTIKGAVTICWRGESNGYYSEEVSFYKVK